MLAGETDSLLLKDIQFKDDWKIGDDYCALYTLADVNNLPSYCGPRINYDKYSTDRTKFSIGFASILGLLLPCNHIYNQYIFIDQPQKAIRQLEAKKLRLQLLSVYSRENAIGCDGRALPVYNPAYPLSRRWYSKGPLCRPTCFI